MHPDLDTVVLLTDPAFTAIHSTVVRDVLSHGGDVSAICSLKLWQHDSHGVRPIDASFPGVGWWLFHAHGMGAWGQTDVVIRWVDEAESLRANWTTRDTPFTSAPGWTAWPNMRSRGPIWWWTHRHQRMEWVDRGVYTVGGLALGLDLRGGRRGSRGRVDTVTLVWPSRRPLKLRGNPLQWCIRKGILAPG